MGEVSSDLADGLIGDVAAGVLKSSRTETCAEAVGGGTGVEFVGGGKLK